MADGIGLGVTTNVEEVLSALERHVALIREVAIPRALNKLADQAQTAGLREVAADYDIPPRTFEKYLGRGFASAAEFRASINAKGSGLPLVLFDPREVPGGISVRVKRKRFFVPHAFFATMRSGHRGVFARGAYGGRGVRTPTGQRFGRFAFGRARLSINELFTFGPAEAWASEDVVRAMQARVDEQFGKVLQQEIRFATGRG